MTVWTGLLAMFLFNTLGWSVPPKHVAYVDGLIIVVVFDVMLLSVSNLVYHKWMNSTKKNLIPLRHTMGGMQCSDYS